MKKVAKDAIGNYSAKAYPKLHSVIGNAGLIAIRKHDISAAKKVAALSECDQVVYVGHSENKSDYPSTIASFVRCKNGKVFYVINNTLQ